VRETLKGADGKAVNLGLNCCIALTDWDADGDLDVLAGVYSKTVGEQRLYFIPNEGGKDGIRSGKPIPITADGAGDDEAPVPCVADWDLDGVPDLLVGCRTGNVLFYKVTRRGKGLPKLSPPVMLVGSSRRKGKKTLGKTPDTVSFKGQYAKVCVTDWNGDGLPDLLLGNFLQIAYRPKLTEAQKADRDRVQGELMECRTRYQNIASKVKDAVRKELGLGLEDDWKKMDRDQQRKYLALVADRLNMDEMIELQRRMGQLRERLRPLSISYPVHGFVWVFQRKSPSR
jgi:hypothetical protein